MYNINMCEVISTDKDLNLIITLAFACGVSLSFCYWLYKIREERPEDERGLFAVFLMVGVLLLLLLVIDYILYV